MANSENVDPLASCFSVWISQDDWESDTYKFYRCLDRAIAQANGRLDASAISNAMQRAYVHVYGKQPTNTLAFEYYAHRAQIIFDYRRATL